MESKNQEAASVVNSTIDRISIIVIVFFLLAALLVLLILLDISKSNYYRIQLIKAKEEAEQLGMVKQRFMANMSHEIRTPLQSIIGFAEQLKGSEQKDAVHAIKHSSEHLLQIVDEVLDYSRIESGQFTLSPESFKLAELMHEITSVVQIQASQKNLPLTVNNFDSPSVVIGDSFRLRQILYNLLSNAIKFTAQGSIGFTCTITSETITHLTCQFQITDTGKGIPTEDHERIFKQFEQGAGNINRHYGGSGLGLSIVKKLVDLQHGTIAVRSEPGVGSVFTVTIPFEKNLAPGMEKQNSITAALSYLEPVWVIDDDPLILKLCSLILKNNNVTHRTFQKPELLLQENLDDVKIIFMDIRMPNIDGIELCKQLKAKAPHLITVALTAHVLPQESATIMQSGFNRILTKPFREHEFLEALTTQESNNGAAHRENEIDLSYIERMTMGDQTLFNSILDEFHSETSKNLIDLEKRLLDQDLEGTREIIHQLAGRLGQFGARPLSHELKRIELHLHEGKKLSEIPELSHAISQIRKFKTELSESVAENKLH
jgi:signal transduction histidine kinase/FixJ family two-component response regulator